MCAATNAVFITAVFITAAFIMAVLNWCSEWWFIDRQQSVALPESEDGLRPEFCTRSGERLGSMGTESTSLLLKLVISEVDFPESDSIVCEIATDAGVHNS